MAEPSVFDVSAGLEQPTLEVPLVLPVELLESLSARLRTPDAFLSRGDLGALGLGRRAVDAVFRELPVIELPGYSKPMVKVRDYQGLIAACTYDGDRVRPCGRSTRHAVL